MQLNDSSSVVLPFPVSHSFEEFTVQSYHIRRKWSWVALLKYPTNNSARNNSPWKLEILLCHGTGLPSSLFLLFPMQVKMKEMRGVEEPVGQVSTNSPFPAGFWHWEAQAVRVKQKWVGTNPGTAWLISCGAKLGAEFCVEQFLLRTLQPSCTRHASSPVLESSARGKQRMHLPGYANRRRVSPP